MDLNEIKRRAQELAQKQIAGSITPVEVGGLIEELARYSQTMERDGATLGIRKVYPTLEAMQADTTPIGDNGKPLRLGNLVAIYQEATAKTDPNSGLVAMWTGSTWSPVARIGTALRHEYTSIEERVSEVERIYQEELKPSDETIKTALEQLQKDIKRALDRNDYTTEDQEKLRRISTEGQESDYLGADGAYHPLPVQRVEVNGVVLQADETGKVSIQTPQGTIKSFRLNGSSLTPTEDGELELGLQLATEPVGEKRIKIILRSADGLELSSIEINQGASGGSGAGFLNISQLVPLSSGYYSLSGALQALRTLSPGASTRPGIIITFETSEGKWVDYRYVGTTTDDTAFYSYPLWQVYSPIREMRLNGQPLMSNNGVLDLRTETAEVARSLDDTDRPVASSVVREAIEELRNFTLTPTLEPTDEGTQVTLDYNGRPVTQFVVAGGGGTGSSISTKAVVTAQLSASRIKLGDKVSLNYSYTHYSDNVADGTPATLSLQVKRGVQLIASISLGVVASGTSASLDLSKYINSADGYSVLLVASYEEEGNLKERKAQAHLSVVNLSLDLYNRSEIEAYLSAGGYKDGDTANIILSVRGGAKEITMYIDGDESSKEVRALTGSASRQTFQLPLRTLSAGSHSLQFVSSVDGLKSNSLYLDVLKAGMDTAFVGLIFKRPDGKIFATGETPEILAYQYEGVTWDYIALSKRTGAASVLTLTTPHGTSSFATPRAYQSLPSRFTQRGSLDYRYSLDDATKSFRVNVLPTTLSGVGVKEGALVELLASGRSNTEANPAQWMSNKVSTTFTGVDFASSGWTGDALRLINGAQALVSYTPFARDAKIQGLTLSFEVKMTNVRRTDEAVISCLDEQAEGGFSGFSISASRVRMLTGGSLEFRSEEGESIIRELGLDMPYASGEYYDITLVIHPSSEEQTIRLYINGVLSKADTYQDTLFVQRNPQGILLNSTDADLELRRIRVYETALSDDEVLTNYITDRPTLAEMDVLRERNDVLSDETGDISYDKLVSRGKAVLSIAMPDGGLERLWGKSTDTKTDHSFTELIYRSPYGASYDLRVTDGIIRRQGTSTSTYPVKNLRIYLQKSKTTKVYRNVSKTSTDQWEEVSDRTYVMREGAKPMKIINLKTDYADSSLCYNTGTARLLNDYLVAQNPSLRNPGMVADPTARMAIDGMPIDVFTSSTLEGTKTYCGQFMFNNDKNKSGALFGQTKKDGSEIALEFINNMNPVANFNITSSSVVEQLGRKGTDGFDASVEFLFPESDYTWNNSKPERVAPENIKQAVIRLWQWIKDCVPTGVDPSNMTEAEVKRSFVSSKFKREVSQYFNVTNLTMWWVLTDYHMSVDQRVKNTFFRTWGNGIWWLTYYDGDTAFGKRNDAFLAYDYNISRDTRDAQRNKYAFEGHNSRLWCLVLANLEDELKASAKLLRTTLTNRVYLDVFDRQIMGAWSERQYNKSGIYKYIRPTHVDYNGTGTMNYVFALGGTMSAYRRQLVDRRFSMLDARYLVGQYESDAVTGYIGKGDLDTQIKATAADQYYFAWKTQNGGLNEHQGVASDEEAVFNFRDAISQNDPVRLIGASRMRKIDFATTSAYLQGAWNFNGCRGLEEIVAPISSGQGTQWYPLLSKITGLKRIDLTGQSGVTGTEDEQARTFDVSSHTGLAELKLSGTRVQGIRIGAGSPLSRLELPQSLSYLRLRALPKLTMSGLVVASWSSIRSLELAGCPQLDWQVLVGKCTGLERLRVEGVDIEDDGTLLARLRRLKGIDASGSGVETCSLVGHCQLTKYIDDSIFARYQEHFPELHIRQPQYTVIEIDDSVLQHANMSNLDNNTGYKFGNEYKPSAHLKKILSGIHRYLGKQTEKGVMSIIKLHDQNSTKYDNGGSYTIAKDAVVDGTQGEVWTLFPYMAYKGVNDIQGKKKYAVISTDPNPDKPAGKKITGEELRALETQRVQTFVSGATLTECVVTMTNSSDYYQRCHPIVAKIPCEGWKRAYTPMSDNFLGIGLIFFDAEDRKMSSVAITPLADDFVSGMNTIVDIPEGAKYFITCYPSSHAPEAYVWLTNSDNPADWEPDWVFCKEWLFSTLPTLNKNGKLISAVDSDIATIHHNNEFGQDISSLSSRGGISCLSYEKFKTFINVWMLSVGSRNPYTAGTMNNPRHRDSNVLDQLSVGMNEVISDPVDGNWGFVTREGIRERVLWSMNNLGVSNIGNSVRVFLDKFIPWAKYASQQEESHVRFGRDDSYPFGIWCESTNRQVWATYNSRGKNYRYTTFGKYMDITPTIKRYDGGASYEAGQGSFLKGSFDSHYNSCVYAFSGNYIGSKSLYFDSEGSKNGRLRFRGNWYGVRTIFEGKIKMITDIDAFEQLENKF